MRRTRTRTRTTRRFGVVGDHTWDLLEEEELELKLKRTRLEEDHIMTTTRTMRRAESDYRNAGAVPGAKAAG